MVRTRLDVLVVKHVVVPQPAMLETIPLRTGLRVLSVRAIVRIHGRGTEPRTYDVYHVVPDRDLRRVLVKRRNRRNLASKDGLYTSNTFLRRKRRAYTRTETYPRRKMNWPIDHADAPSSQSRSLLANIHHRRTHQFDETALPELSIQMARSHSF